MTRIPFNRHQRAGKPNLRKRRYTDQLANDQNRKIQICLPGQPTVPPPSVNLPQKFITMKSPLSLSAAPFRFPTVSRRHRAAHRVVTYPAANPATTASAEHPTDRLLSALIVIATCLLLCCTAQGESTTDETERPNILLCIADDWSYGHAGAYGCDWVQTPGFDQVAEQGVVFTHAYTPNAKCAPSRAAILTGRNSWQLEEACNHICDFPPKFKTYVEALKVAGYQVGTTGKGWGPGIAKDVNGKNRQMTGVPFTKRTAKPPAKHISANDYATNFDDFIRSVDTSQPWCFWYGATEPHRAYEYGVGQRIAGKKLSDIDRVPGYWPDNETVRNDMLDYAVEVEHFDKHTQRILDQLKSLGELDNTLVIVTSDHGMPFPRVKGQAYESSNHVPLAIMWPQRMQHTGRRIDDYVSLIDLAPTILDATGLQIQESIMQPVTGKSLVALLESDLEGQVDPNRDHVLIGKERHDIGRPNDWGYPIRGIIQDDMLFIQNYEIDRWPAGNPETGYLNTDGSPTKSVILEGRRDGTDTVHWDQCFGKRQSEELYDLSADQDCLVNLAKNSDYARIMRALRNQMNAELKLQDDPRMFGKGETFEQMEYVNSGTKNFYERYMNGEKMNAGWVNKDDFETAPIE
ncbi:Arylsulfatase precursor [Crateriforma conspicua]|uniref:Arylsulfatase n=2 Tax=Crateriforma conspicua TaxID=2527996 RepID=A0A5C5Y996_9PLAN|nr:Arylsulfatase precursor [Crateriforma conspicua]